MMIEPLYDFSLTAEQEARARTLHESSIILDMLFQGPVGTYSLPEGAEEELLALAQKACPGDEIAQCNWATAEILRRMIGGSYSQLYKDCWYDSGLTAAAASSALRTEMRRCARQLSCRLSSYLPVAGQMHVGRTDPPLQKEGLKAGIVTSQEAEGYSKDLKLLELLYNYGLRVQQLSYNNQNLIGAGCMEPNGGAGLSKFGYPVCGKVQRAWYRGRYRTLRLSYHDGCLQVQQGACHRIPYRRGEGQLPRTLQE